MVRSLKSAIEESDAKPSKSKRPGKGGRLKAEPLPKEETAAKPTKTIDDEFLKEAIERCDEGYRHDADNIAEAYEDLEFLAGNQWPEWAKRKRVAQNRPMLTFPVLAQFARQVSGDMRLMKPAIKATPADGLARPEIAELISGMIRYIENRSEARAAYAISGDGQVACGKAAWRVTTEYAEETTFNQELRIVQIDDGISVIWDPDAILPTREDGAWCFVPIDYSRRKFKEKWPNVPVESFEQFDRSFHAFWFDKDRVRVAEYWEKRPAKRKLALMKNGSVIDLTGKDEKEVAELQAQGGVERVEERDGHKVYRSVITLGHVLEAPEEWAGRYIPIVPLMGEEIRIGRRIVRRGVIRQAKDVQSLFNFTRTTQAELAALAPKAPFIGTDKNFEEHADEWAVANEEALPYLRYVPDSRNGNIPPQRSQGAFANSGLSELAGNALSDMKAIIGIYDAGLGNRSNETSGVAIKARQNESDVATAVYSDNFSLAIRHTGKIIVDLLPHVYDTERQVQIVHEDGRAETVTINKGMVSPNIEDESPDEAEDGLAPVEDTGGLDMESDDEGDAAAKPAGPIVLNDVTVGSYGIVIEMGPSYSTRREEARDGMESLIKAAPQIAPLILDLYVREQDWPMAGDIADRIVATLPPPIQAMIAAKKRSIGEIPSGPDRPGIPGAMPGMPGAPPMPMPPGGPMLPPGAPMPPPPPGPPPPTPAELATQHADVVKATSAAEVAAINREIKNVELEIRRLDLAIASANAASAGGTSPETLAVLKQIMAELVHHHGMIEELASQIPHPDDAQAQPGAESGAAPPPA